MRADRLSSLLPVAAVIAVASLLLLGCGDEDDAASTATPSSSTSSTSPSSSSPSSSSTSTSTPTSTSTTSTTEALVVVEIDETSFININDMTPVRGFFVGNLLGDLDATLAVAENPDGGIWPAGSIVQLVPQEAMVKREAGFSPETNDWEFFELLPDAEGTKINVRGGAEAVNQFGGSCADCHSFAEPQFDFICEQTNGCEPLPLTRELIESIQAGDPRPRTTG